MEMISNAGSGLTVVIGEIYMESSIPAFIFSALAENLLDFVFM